MLPRVVGMGGEGARSYMVMEKTPSAIPALRGILAEFMLPKTGIIYTMEEDELFDEDMVDRIEHARNGTYDLDIVFGNVRIFLIMRTAIPREEWFPRVMKHLSAEGRPGPGSIAQ